LDPLFFVGVFGTTQQQVDAEMKLK